MTTCAGASGGMIHRPFHLGRKDAHQCRSDLKSTVNLMWCLGCFAIFIRSIMRRRNVRPGSTTIAAWLRCPMSDCSSLLDAVFLPCQVRTSPSMRVSLSPGRLSVMARVSTFIPSNVSWVAGPSVLCVATGTPSSLHMSSATSSAFAHGSSTGDPMNRKSSK